MEQATKLAAVIMSGLLALTLLAGGFLLILSSLDPLLALIVVQWALSMVKWAFFGACGAIWFACKASIEGFFGAFGEHSYQKASVMLAWVFALMVVGLPQGRSLPRPVSNKTGRGRHRLVRGKHRAFRREWK